MKIRYARGTSKFDAHPELREAPDFDAFARVLLADRATAKGLQYVCAPLKLNGSGTPHRCKADVEPRRWLALDIDRIKGPETFADLRLWLLRFRGFGFTTASSTAAAPRCRIVIELDRDIDRGEGLRLGAALARDISEEFAETVKLDPSTHRGEQPCYLPVLTSETFTLDGDPLDVNRWLDGAPEIEPERKGSADIAPEDDPVIQRLKERGLYLRSLSSGRHAIRCPWGAEHTTNDDAQSTATCYLQPHFSGYLSPGFKCLHDHCAGRDGDDLLASLGIDWRQTKNAHKPANGATTGDWPAALDLADLATRDPQPPKQIMEGLPCGYCTIDAGHGGAGKSAIELYRAVCIAAGIPFCGLPVERRKVLFASCEDRADVLHWRLTRICRYLGIELADLNGWLFILDLVGRDSILFSPDPRTGNVFTAAYGFLAERMREYGAEVLMLDGVTDTFGGNENDRAQVKRFVNSLLALIPADRGALLLVAHVNKATASNGSTSEGYSGSTGWNNAPRARWYLYPETVRDDDGGAQRTGKLVLELQKANHGETGTRIEFAWDPDAHLFVGRAKGGMMEFDRRQRDQAEQTGILHALKGIADAGLYTPAAMTGPRSAYLVLSQCPKFPESLKGGSAEKKRRFWRQIEALRQMRHIEEGSIQRKHRHHTATLVLTTEGRSVCA